MPVQQSKRGQSITSAGFEEPFESQFTRFGIKGLNINDAIDAVEPDELTRMLNVTHRVDMAITSRAGQTNITGAAVGTNHHSIKRLNDPSTDTWTRIQGVDTSLYVGQGALTSVDSGYSGEPLSLVPYHPPFSNEPWMYVADSSRMRKVRSDGLDLPIGLPAPSNVATSALAAENRTTIADFTSDGTQYTNWTANGGFTYGTPPVAVVGEIVGPITDDESAPALHFGTIGTAATPDGYFSSYGVPKSMNLSVVGAETATDDDYIHLRLNFSHTQYIKEFRVYLVCSSGFSSSIIPGTAGTTNGDAYVKAFSANDFAAYIQAQLTQFDAAELSRIRELRDDNLRESTPVMTDPRNAKIRGDANLNTIRANAELDRTITQQSNAASDMWQTFGVVSIPLRRGDWQRIGATAGRDWSTITGIITYIQTGPSGDAPVEDVAVRISQFYMTGGSDPDTGEAVASPYDYRYTHYDTRTGAEGNPSPEMTTTAYLDTLRRSINVTPTSYGDAAVRQRFYRRGGTLPTDWFFVGENSSDGGVFVDDVSDLEASTSGTVELDNDQPVSTVDEDGETVLNQPIPILWGPLNDVLFGCGDPTRPGVVYFCKPGEPDSWPPDFTVEVTSPSEELMAGIMYGTQSFVFSSERCFVLYTSFSSDSTSVTASLTQCTRGPINRWALVGGMGGIYFVNNDGVYRTSAGGPEEWLSKKIDPIFNGKTANGYLSIDWTQDTAIRLEIFENELYFQYEDTGGDRQVLVYSIPFGFWRAYTFAAEPSTFYADEGNPEPVMLIGGASTGKTYEFDGFSDDGTAIDCEFRTGVLDFGRPRMEKRFGDQLLDVDTQDVVITLQNHVNNETTTNAADTLTAAAGRSRAIFDTFGDTPQRAFNISTDLSWSSATAAPLIYQLGTTMLVEPDVTVNRVTQWDDLGHPDESYLTGVTFDCDTGGVARNILIESDYNGLVNLIATLVVNCDGRHKVKFSWPAAQVHKIRIRPNDDCLAWILYKVDWISVPEPPRIAGWDTYFENGWDQYYTGVDLFCDTSGLDKTLEVYVDELLVGTYTVNTSGRKVFHITLPWGRGHVFHLVATDDNPGILYDVRWHLDPEPSEQTNWNQNFTVAGALNDKYLKALLFQCDTFGEDKSVTVECDGVVVETLTVNANGRKVVQQSFPQHLGRVFRVYPTDSNPGRLYSLQWVFDSEPLALARWETQQITHGFNSWHYPIWSNITVKSTADVTLEVSAYTQDGSAQIRQYTLDNTFNEKIKLFVPFEATKGIMYKYLLTSEEPFWLYREETVVYVREWGTDATATTHMFGNDDLDQTRGMSNAELAAARPGGTL